MAFQWSLDVPPCWAIGINPLEAYAADDLLAPRLPKSSHTPQKRGRNRGACVDAAGFGWQCCRPHRLASACLGLAINVSLFASRTDQLHPFAALSWLLKGTPTAPRIINIYSFLSFSSWYLWIHGTLCFSFAFPAGGRAWTGASRSFGPWLRQGPHTGCQLCCPGGCRRLCQRRANWLSHTEVTAKCLVLQIISKISKTVIPQHILNTIQHSMTHSIQSTDLQHSIRIESYRYSYHTINIDRILLEWYSIVFAHGFWRRPICAMQSPQLLCTSEKLHKLHLHLALIFR